jgi:hypothetical protein
VQPGPADTKAKSVAEIDEANKAIEERMTR